MADQILGQFTSGMDRRTRRGGKSGPQQLWSLINGYINSKKDVVPRPGLRHVADVPNSVGLYGFSGQLHVFHSGDEGFVDPGNPLIQPHILRYPLDDTFSLAGALENGTIGTPYTAHLNTVNGTAPFTWSVDGVLPPGLSLNTSTGIISGTPT